MEELVQRLTVFAADTYALYLKTQNFHWHVKGPHFPSYHALFETQYQALAEAVDALAERLVILGSQAPATFTALQQHTTLAPGDADLDATEMINALADDHDAMVKAAGEIITAAADIGDEVTVDLLTGRMAAHEQFCWVLSSSL